MNRLPSMVAITIGDPAGIGPEIALKTARNVAPEVGVVVVGDLDVVRRVNEDCDFGITLTELAEVTRERATQADIVPVIDLDNVSDHEYGVVRGDYGQASLEYLEYALRKVTDGDLGGVVGGPVNAKAITRSNFRFDSPSSLVLHYADVDQYSIMLSTEGLHVSHVTPEVPLKDVPDLVTEETTLQTIHMTERMMRDLGTADPRIAVAGLNPHAGLDGLRGDEDDRKIRPAIETAQDEGIDAVGPESPDTVFASALNGAFDAVVSMYHDQGHIPVKTVGSMDGEIDVSAIPLGLPFPYSALGHGTAFDIAGHCEASPASAERSIRLVAQIARNADAS